MWQTLEQMLWYSHNQIRASELDAVLLLGNGIGLYGQPTGLEKGLEHIFEMLRPGGVLIGEGGRFCNTPGYSEKQVEITFVEGKPTKFPWLFCDWTWLEPRLKAAGFEIIPDEEANKDNKDISSDEPGGFLFVAKKPSNPTEYWEKVLNRLRPEDRATSSSTTPIISLEDVLRVAQSRSARLPRGNTPEDHIRHHTAKNAVFFYPACGFDWEPLYRFSGRCDTFIYCDYMFILEHVVEKLKNLPRCLRVNHSTIIPPDFVHTMINDSLMPEDIKRRVTVIEPWGCLLSLTGHVTSPPKRLHLLYLAVEGVTLYSNLFARHAHPFLKRVWAPEYLYIKNDGRGFGNGWADFEDWQRPLGRVVDQNPKKPKYVASAGRNWPWSQCWLTFNTWHGEFPECVSVCRQPEIAPTEREARAFRLPGIPPNEWPEIH